MNDPTEGAVETYHRFQARTVAGSATAHGIAEDWAAPTAVFEASDGFGEEAWVDALPVTTIATRLRGAPVTWCSGRLAGKTSYPGPSALQPKGSANHFRAVGAVRFSQIYVSDGLIDRVADAIRPGAIASDRLRDDLIFIADDHLDRRIKAYLNAATHSASALEMEASAILLVGYLLRAHHGFAEVTPIRGGLAPWQIKRACEAMMAHLDQDIGLDMLAGIAGCSPTHFSRAFRQSTGMPPFQWLLERRIERAKDMLTDASVPLVDVALAVGFSAQPQFTTAFKRATGVTPGAWRRERLS